MLLTRSKQPQMLPATCCLVYVGLYIKNTMWLKCYSRADYSQAGPDSKLINLSCDSLDYDKTFKDKLNIIFSRVTSNLLSL